MKIHLLGACGMGMGSLAGLLQESGHEVSGCDRSCEPPMSECLAEWGIKVELGFHPKHLDQALDLVVVGNVCRADNPEARAALERGMQVASFPQVLGEMFLQQRHSVVVAGTHGKTTTAALIAYLLTQAGRDPSYLFGGILLSSRRGFRLGKGGIFVVEGDEYDSAFFDKRPKFIHYRPKTLVLASLEYDHADIYPNREAYLQAFRSLVSLLPVDGLLVACRDYPLVAEVARLSKAPTVFYGLTDGVGWRATAFEHTPEAISFDVLVNGRKCGRARLPLAGEHNAANALAALVVGDSLGVKAQEALAHLENFPGVARRMQERGTAGGVTVVDDFAHHPTKVRVTIRAARRKYAGAYLVAVFEPRSNTSRRKFFQAEYAESFDDADEIVLVPPYLAEQIGESERLDCNRLVQDLRARGKPARLLPNAQVVAETLAAELAPGSVVLIMSNGSFGGLHGALLRALSQRAGGDR